MWPQHCVRHLPTGHQHGLIRLSPRQLRCFSDAEIPGASWIAVGRRPPAQADMQRSFQVTPPTVHQMLLTLENARLISRQPGAARSIAVQVARADLPTLIPGYAQTVKTTVQRY